MSPLPLRLPNFSPESEGAEGVTFAPLTQVSAWSAALGSESCRVNPDPLRLRGGSTSGVRVCLAAIAERQSEVSSATLETRSLGGPSKRRGGRESRVSGKGPSRRQGLSNLPSSSNPPPRSPKPPFSLAKCREV
jgi:hypothetical protein